MTRIFEVVSPAPQNIWSELFEGNQSATPFQSPQWMKSMVAGGRYVNASRFYHISGRRLVLPLAERGVMPGVRNAASLPHGLGAGGLLSDGKLASEDVDLILGDLARLPFFKMSVRPNPLQAAAWVKGAPADWKVEPKLTHVLDLRGGYETVWSERFHSVKRNRVRKGERSGIEIVQGNTDDLVAVFYDLYLKWSENRARARSLPLGLVRWMARRREPFWKFSSMARGMGDGLRIYIARHEGAAIAGAVFLVAGSAAVYWRGASDVVRSGPVAGNDFLQARMIMDACELGCTAYHMGESGGVESLIRFKEHFGCNPVRYAEYVKEKLPVTPILRGFERNISWLADRLQKSAGAR